MEKGNPGFIELTCILKTSDQKRRICSLLGIQQKKGEGREREQGMHEKEGILQQGPSPSSWRTSNALFFLSTVLYMGLKESYNL